MKVLWLAPYPYPGSDAHPAPWISTLAKGLVNGGVSLTVLSYSSALTTKEKKIENDGIEIIYLKVPSLKRDIISLYTERIRIIKKWLLLNYRNYDIIHIHGTEHQYEAAATKIDLPKIISIQGLLHECVKVIPEKISIRKLTWQLGCIYERKYIPKYNYFFCRTNWDMKIVSRLNPQAQIYKVWEPIRKEFFRDEEIDCSLNDSMLYMGGLNNLKGINETLIAFNNLLKNRKLKLIILGRGMCDEYERLIKKLKLKNIDFETHIVVKGFCDTEAVIDSMKNSLCLIHPSYVDNSPNSICEAQVLGLPVIATDVGGVSSLIENNVTGILIKNEPRSIELAVERLMNDTSLASQISKSSMCVARKRHNTQNIISHVLNIYNSILNE